MLVAVPTLPRRLDFGQGVPPSAVQFVSRRRSVSIRSDVFDAAERRSGGDQISAKLVPSIWH